MAIPKTGSRKISVEGYEYRWLIRKKATYSQADYGIGCLHVAIDLLHEPGTTAVIVTDYPHPQDWATVEVRPVIPFDVSNWILRAIELGWAPSAKGSPMMFKLEGGRLELMSKR
ncbi:MAG: hypothetical protein LBQ81_03085 [Zoogloeaceae bacterium]|jgi:hypothetical protein|nr:hypothetical protein [Zoogloeaceae bacterium]